MSVSQCKIDNNFGNSCEGVRKWYEEECKRLGLQSRGANRLVYIHHSMHLVVYIGFKTVTINPEVTEILIGTIPSTSKVISIFQWLIDKFYTL